MKSEVPVQLSSNSCGTARAGTPEEGEQISTDWQQNQHAVEIQAGCRGPGQWQRKPKKFSSVIELRSREIYPIEVDKEEDVHPQPHQLQKEK